MSIAPNPEPTPPVRLFLSHATADVAILTWVKGQAEAMGIEPYLAELDPQPGRSLGDKVVEAIKTCDALLVLLTDRGYASTFVQQEVGAARLAGKPILALVAQEVLDRDRAMLNGAEVIVLDMNDLVSSSATLTASLRSLSAARGMAPPPLELRTQPVLQIELGVQLHLTADQVLLGLLLLTACAGLVYLASREGTALSSPTS